MRNDLKDFFILEANKVIKFYFTLLHKGSLIMSNYTNSLMNLDVHLAGGGEMGRLTRSFNWSENPLGEPDQWSPAMLTTLSTLLRSKFPMFLWWGTELIQFYNDAYRPSLGNTGKHPNALGQRGEDCWPEIWSVIKPLIDQVMAGGDSVWSEDQLIPIYRDGKIQDVYWTFSYCAVIDKTGQPGGVLVICNETTEKVKDKQKIAEGYNKEQLLNEKLRLANALLADANLAALKTNNELAEAQQSLSKTLNELRKSERNFRDMIVQAPVAMCLLLGPEHTIAVANNLIIDIWGKPSVDIINKPIFEALPDAKEQGLENLLDDVYRTGIEYRENERPISLFRNGVYETIYLNFVYHPYKDVEGNVLGVIAITIDMTESVRVRKEMERGYEQARLSKEAAQLGTFDMDMEKGTMEWDERCRELFGISHHDTVTYEKDFVTGLHPEDREKIVDIIGKVFIKSISNGVYDVEYRTVGVEDRKIRWVRAKGQAYFDPNEKPIRFIGSVLDITEQKLDELRKSDFIGMVSHELKTPITVVNGYVQILQEHVKDLNDPFTILTLDKVNAQIQKMKTMVNGFLSISRRASGKLILDKREFELDRQILSIIEDTEILTSSHKIKLVANSNMVVNADKDKINAVISNLISNAIKYSPIGSNIIVGCEQINSFIQIRVSDEGMGIEEQHLSRLFDRFYRIENKNTQNIAGFGIGLYLSAEIVHHHGGKIWVESEIGKGSTFYFTIPVIVGA